MIITPKAPTPLFPFQTTGVSVLANRARVGLHDVMGLGKTAQMIRAADAIQAKRGMVIVPAKLRKNIIRQFTLWAQHGYRITEGRDVHDFIAWQRGRYHIIVPSYEQATKWASSIYASGEPIDFVALDEAHALKNSDAHRTLAILGPKYDGSNALISWAEHVWHMTGTMMANDPLDCWTFLRMCNATTLSQAAFTKRYFYSDRSVYGSRQTIKPEMQAELLSLVDGNRIRRTLTEVGIQLPPIMADQLVVDGDTSVILDLLKQFPTLDHAIIQAIHTGGMSFLDAQHVMTLRRLLGEAKAVPYAHILLNDILSTGEKFVVMGFHVDALTFIYQFLKRHNVRCVLVNGSVSDKQADKAVQEFQDDPYCMCFIGNMQSAGQGSDLFAACHLDVLESDWTPKGNAQAVMRIYRIGQTRPCFVRFVSLARTFDESVTDLVIQKTTAIAEIDGTRMLAHA